MRVSGIAPRAARMGRKGLEKLLTLSCRVGIKTIKLAFFYLIKSNTKILYRFISILLIFFTLILILFGKISQQVSMVVAFVFYLSYLPFSCYPSTSTPQRWVLSKKTLVGFFRILKARSFCVIRP